MANRHSPSRIQIDISRLDREVYLYSKALERTLALTQERAEHIHPEVKIFQNEFYETLKIGFIFQKDTGEIVLYKWFKSILHGKYMIVIVVDRNVNRAFIVTAMVTKRPPKGVPHEIKTQE